MYRYSNYQLIVVFDYDVVITYQTKVCMNLVVCTMFTRRHVNPFCNSLTIVNHFICLFRFTTLYVNKGIKWIYWYHGIYIFILQQKFATKYYYNDDRCNIVMNYCVLKCEI